MLYRGPQTRICHTQSIRSIQFSCSVVSDSLRPHESQHARPPCPSPTPGVHSNSGPSSQWCRPAISSSVVPFSSCPQSLPASESFPMTQLFTWGSQSIGVSALASVLPMNTQDWSPLRWTGWTSLQSKGFSRVFSNTTVKKHQFFGAQLSSQSNSHIHISIGKTIVLTKWVSRYYSSGCPLGWEIHLWRDEITDGCDIFVYWYEIFHILVLRVISSV